MFRASGMCAIVDAEGAQSFNERAQRSHKTLCVLCTFTLCILGIRCGKPLAPPFPQRGAAGEGQDGV